MILTSLPTEFMTQITRAKYDLNRLEGRKIFYGYSKFYRFISLLSVSLVLMQDPLPPISQLFRPTIHACFRLIPKSSF